MCRLVNKGKVSALASYQVTDILAEKKKKRFEDGSVIWDVQLIPFMETWYYVPETRWMSRGKILCTFRKGFPAIMKFLQGRGDLPPQFKDS